MRLSSGTNATLIGALIALACNVHCVKSLHVRQPASHSFISSRRAWWTNQVAAPAAIIFAPFVPIRPCQAASSAGPPPNLNFIETPSGLQYADAKVGTGQPITQKGSSVSIDYVMSTTGARYGTKIYSTQDKNAPYRFVLGDGTTIEGLEMAIAGDKNGIEPMRPGGVRRVILPSNLAYASLAKPIPGLQYQDCQEGKGVGPIPPKDEGAASEYYQRFKNIYCNANRYQPDLVMDVKLYGKR